MRNRAFRRHQINRHMTRRLSEDRNQHYDNLDCLCWREPRVIAWFKEQPKLCSCAGCGNPRRFEKRSRALTMQELRADVAIDRNGGFDSAIAA